MLDRNMLSMGWKVCLAIGMLAGAVGLRPAMADEIIAYDSFETYTPGDTFIGENGGTGWAGAYTSFEDTDRSTAQTKSLTYSNGAINITGGNVAGRYSDNATLSFGTVYLRQLPAVTADVVYFSVMVNAHVPVMDNFWQFGLQDTNANNALDASFYISDTGISIRANNSNQAVAAGLVTDQTYLMVVKLEKISSSSTYNRLTAYFNPDDLIEGNNTSVTLNADSALDLTSGGYFGFRKSSYTAGDELFFDNIRIGTTFESVVVVPEPGSLGMLLLALPLMRRRKH